MSGARLCDGYARGSNFGPLHQQKMVTLMLPGPNVLFLCRRMDGPEPGKDHLIDEGSGRPRERIKLLK